MKKMNLSSIPSKKDVSYSFIEECLIIDGVYIRPAEGIRNRNLTEKHFKDISHRDHSIERLLMIAASMLVDFHYHHPRIIFHPWSDNPDEMSLWDRTPQEYEELLYEVHTCCHLIFQRVFQGDWRSMTGYLRLAVALLEDVMESLHDFDVVLLPHEELIGMIPVAEKREKVIRHSNFFRMKDLTNATASQPRGELVYSSLIDEFMVNGQYPKYDLVWVSSNYRDCHFSAIKNRNCSLEFRLKYVNSLLMEYHTHRYWTWDIDCFDNTYEYVYDENPEQSKAVLLRAKDYVDVVIDSLFDSELKRIHEYCILAVALLFEVYEELRNYGIYENAMERLKGIWGDLVFDF